MMDWILLIARWIAGLFLLLVAVIAFVFTVRKKAPAKGWEGLAVAAFAGSLAAWLLSLQTVCLWGLLAGFIPFLVRELSGKKSTETAPAPPSAAPAGLTHPDGPPRQISAAERRVMELRRGVPFTDEELAARAKFDADIQFGLAVWEGERGRILREDTLPEAVAYLKRLQADSKIQEAEQDRLDAEKEAADETAREAAAKEMITPPAAARQCRMVLKKECRIRGDSGESLLLPPGPVDLHLSFSMEPGADAEGVPLLKATVWTGSSSRITRCLNLVEIIDFEHLKSAGG
ncbi:MAG TPA: hypothetical protein VHM91_25470, partial [Verrucomicrobiales bacterium]|nr:hypothetical protein [Verrucomicrobiales bacterium]